MNSKSIRSYLLAGFVVWLPILVTFAVLRFIIELLDKTLEFIPTEYQPEQLIGMHIPGLGVVISLVLLLVTGIFATNFFGARLVGLGERLLEKIPLVRSIYNATKQVLQTIFSSNGQAFRKVLLVEFPRKGMWSVAFQTAVVSNKLAENSSDDMLTVFIPATPNPTSGFMLLVPKSEAIELNMTIDEAFKLIISLGVMQP